MRTELPTKEHRAVATCPPPPVPKEKDHPVRSAIAVSGVPGAVLARNEPTAVDKALLGLGIVAPLVYAASDVIAGSRWEGYSFRDQTISELNAIGSPTRTLTIVLGLVGYSLLIGFGVGVWRSASLNRRLRVVGAALVLLGLNALWSVPFGSMHVREAEESLTDTLHLVGLPIAGGLLLVIIGLGAGTFGRRLRLYTAATVLVTLVFSAWSGMDGAAIADNLATPWVGVKERIAVYSYQLWLVVFAVAVLGRRLAARANGRTKDAVAQEPTTVGSEPRVAVCSTRDERAA